MKVKKVRNFITKEINNNLDHYLRKVVKINCMDLIIIKII